MPRHGTRGMARVSVRLAAATLCAAWPLGAQEQSAGRQGPVWSVEGLQVGQCIRFLMDPAAVGKQLRTGRRLIRADQDQTLHPSLRSVVEQQAEFASWAPSSLCLFYSDAIRLGARRLGSKDPRRKQMLGVWTVAATEQGSSRRDIVLDLFGSGGELAHSAEQAKVKLREARSTRSKAAGTGNDIYGVRVGKTHLIWNGRAAGDSSRVGAPIRELWVTRGASGTLWRAEMTFRPAWTRSLVGVLTVEGKDDLAKALKASPSRFVGPLYHGGDAELRFFR